MIDFGMSPQEALDAPRFSYRPLEGEVGLEPRIPADVVDELWERGAQNHRYRLASALLRGRPGDRAGCGERSAHRGERAAE